MFSNLQGYWPQYPQMPISNVIQYPQMPYSSMIYPTMTLSAYVIIVYALSSYARKSGEPLLFIWISLWSTVICLVNKYVLYQNVLCTYGTKKIFLDETKWEIWRGVNCIHTSPGRGAWKNPTRATVEYEILCTRLRLDAQYFVLHCCPRWVFSYTTPRRGVYTLKQTY